MRLATNVLLGLLILGVFATFAIARAYPALNGWQTAHVRGISMEPTITLHALIYVQPADQYQVGDIVTFLDPNGSRVTHRITGDWSGIGKGPWQTQGDNNDQPDPILQPTEAFIGKVAGWVPLFGVIAATITTLPVMLFLLFLGATLVYLPSVASPRQAKEAPA